MCRIEKCVKCVIVEIVSSCAFKSLKNEFNLLNVLLRVHIRILARIYERPNRGRISFTEMDGLSSSCVQHPNGCFSLKNWQEALAGAIFIRLQNGLYQKKAEVISNKEAKF